MSLDPPPQPPTSTDDHAAAAVVGVDPKKASTHRHHRRRRPAGLYTPRAEFRRVLKEYIGNLRISRDAAVLLQYAVEQSTASLVRRATLFTASRKQITLTDADILACRRTTSANAVPINPRWLTKK